MVKDYQETEAPFNMAVATLMRLDSILQQIRNLNYLYPFDSATKQKTILELVKQFYINSVTLLKPENVQQFENILNLRVDEKIKIVNGVQKTIPVYTPSLDLKMNKILIELQQLLRKYFMPKGKELRIASEVID